MTGVCRLMPGPQWLVFPAGPLCGLTIGPRALAQAPDSPVAAEPGGATGGAGTTAAGVSFPSSCQL